jgi:DNA invertase Pin-like site-specific DNA recombinase
MTAFIAYLRISTQKQQMSGLGREAQEEAVRGFIGAGDKLLATYTEIESGTNCDRPALKGALDRCRLTGATLLVAKWDRLSRNVAFLSRLMESDVPLVAADNPHATRFTLHILAAVAEHEADAISKRTIAALAAAKRRGTILGGFKGRQLTAAERAKGTALRVSKARARAGQVATVVEELRLEGSRTFREIALELNQRGVLAPRGGRWAAAQVRATLLQATSSGARKGYLPV